MMIDMEEWRVKKKEEKKALKPDRIDTRDEICNEEQEIDAELPIEEESARRMTTKRKECREEKLKPAIRRKLAPLTNWGEKLTEQRQGVFDWLVVPEEAKIVEEEEDGDWRRTEVKVAKSKKLW